MLRYISILAGLLISGSLFGQAVPEYNSVQLNALVQASPAKITLTWKKLPAATGYTVYKKAKEATGWATLGNVSSSDSFYVDNAVIADSAYEYAVVKNGGNAAYGYIYAAVRAPAIHNRGAMMLLVDNTFATTCSAELETLMEDLRGDGWEVIRRDFSRTAKDVDIKNAIINAYNTNSRLKAVFIVGHLAVPYSGNIKPDAHPNHEGAWPADVYYADVDGVWTDASINNTIAGRPQNDNVPGDGKWDQSELPSDVELQMGRIDFADMPVFSKTEEQMMKSYLNRAHQYKMNTLAVQKRALIDDNFGVFSGEAFAQNGWRNFATLVGRDQIKSLDYLTTIQTDSYQWVYGCGSGSYTSCAGVGTSAGIAGKNINAIFTMMFGSYFGDWDSQNNFLRASLCADVPALTAYWAGRPNAFLHHMALGEHIGYSTFLSQNNRLLYGPTNYGSRMVHQALMGDPSLRAEYVSPPGNVTLTSGTNLGAQLSWSASAEPGVAGYYVYRSDSEFGHYSLRSGLVAGTSYTDSFGTDGNYYYMVRAAKLQETPSGSYYNLSLGEVDDAYVSYPLGVYEAATAAMQLSLYPNPAKDKLYLNITLEKGGKFDIYIQDIYGRKIQRRAETLAAGSHKVTFDIEALPAGVYTISVQQGDGEIVKKWVKGE